MDLMLRPRHALRNSRHRLNIRKHLSIYIGKGVLRRTSFPSFPVSAQVGQVEKRVNYHIERPEAVAAKHLQSALQRRVQ
jgi:hypothetical protein